MTEPIPTWAMEAARKVAAEHARMVWVPASSGPSKVEVIALALVEQRSIGDRAGWLRLRARIVELEREPTEAEVDTCHAELDNFYGKSDEHGEAVIQVLRVFVAGRK